jgi:hypothetical protein
LNTDKIFKESLSVFNQCFIRGCFLLLTALFVHSIHAEPVVLKPDDYRHYVEKFNAADEEAVVNLIANAKAWDWMVQEIPFFDCPAGQFEEIYYFRWWSFRKHIKQTDDGLVLTEFITPVNHAGKYNTIACAVGHHLAEGRWLNDQKLLDEYVKFWFHSGPDGGPMPHSHKFSSWVPAALFQRSLVTGDQESLVDLLDDLVADYGVWITERGTPDGMFWQHDVKDGMEESISGGRHVQNVRPTINSYMAANAEAISKVAKIAGREDVAKEFSEKADDLRVKLNAELWDPEAKFFKVKTAEGEFSDAREQIGFIPWMFDLADDDRAVAWLQLKDREGFWAPWGITTAERRHPAFRTHGTGTCEWDGAVWPFATSQTLTGLANLLQNQEQDYITKRDYFEQLLTYARSHQQDGVAYIGEYLDETTGEWLITGEKEKRSRFYNHSTFCDLVISGLVGIVPQEGNTLVVDPLLPSDAWDWFCLDGMPYHGHNVTVIWDRFGKRYNRGTGLIVLVDGKEAGRSPELSRLEIKLSQ